LFCPKRKVFKTAFFESFFKVTPKRVTDSTVFGELYMGEWYPFYLRNFMGLVSGKTISFDRVTQDLLDILDEFEEVPEGVFLRREIMSQTRDRKLKAFIYEANINNEYVRMFTKPQNRIVVGDFRLSEKTLEEAKKYLK
jgi:hypothetical protein